VVFVWRGAPAFEWLYTASSPPYALWKQFPLEYSTDLQPKIDHVGVFNRMPDTSTWLTLVLLHVSNTLTC